MKKSILSICLLASGVAFGQTTTETTPSSMSTSTTTTTTNTNATVNPSGTPTTPNSPTDMRTGTTTNSNSSYPAGNTGTTTTGTGAMNSAPTTYDRTTTTTTTTSDYNAGSTTRDMNSNRDANDTRAMGKDGKFGLYAGLNFSRFINEPIPDDAYRTGFQVGVYGRSAGTVFGQIGLEYRNSTENLIRRGSVLGTPTTPGGPTSSEISGQINQHFLAIPAYVGLRIGSLAGLRLQAGAELSSMVAIGENNFKLGRDDINRTILNGLLAAGINLGPVTLDAIYNLGLQNVFDGLDTKRRMLQFNVGFRF